MKVNFDPDFKVIPSAIPLKSPSPDHKSSNNLTPTKSPNTIQIKKNITPQKVSIPRPKREGLNFDISTNVKYHTQSPSNQSQSLQDKDQIIRELKNIINLITENSRYGRSEDDITELKNQIKILTIENQKLVNIIDKNGSKSQKITLVKIKQQYAENIKLLQEELEQQIKQSFDTMAIGLNGLDVKCAAMGNRLESIEKVVWDRLKSKIKKSEIYIEQAPSSSSDHEKISKDQLSRVLANQKKELQEKVAQLSAELEQLRFKYQKICLDTSSIAFSERQPPVEKKYEEALKVVEEKDHKIEQLLLIIQNLQEKMEKEEPKTFQDSRQRDEQLEKINSEMEIKVKLLVESYEKQLQMLRKEIIMKNASLSDINDMSNQEKTSMRSNIDEINKIREEEINQNRAIKAQLQKKLTEEEIKYNDLLNQKNNLEKRLSEVENEHNEVKQTKQKEIIMQLVEINKYKGECAQLEEKVNDQVQKINTIQNENDRLHEELSRQKQQTQTQLDRKTNQITILKEKLSDISLREELERMNNILMEQEGEIKSITQKTSKLSKQMENKGEQISTLQKAHSQLQQRLSAKEESQIILKNKLQELQQLNQLYKKDAENHKKENNKLSQQIKCLQQENLVEETSIEQHHLQNQHLSSIVKALIEAEDERSKQFKTIFQQ